MWQRRHSQRIRSRDDAPSKQHGNKFMGVDWLNSHASASSHSPPTLLPLLGSLGNPRILVLGLRFVNRCSSHRTIDSSHSLQQPASSRSRPPRAEDDMQRPAFPVQPSAQCLRSIFGRLTIGRQSIARPIVICPVVLQPRCITAFTLQDASRNTSRKDRAGIRRQLLMCLSN